MPSAVAASEISWQAITGKIAKQRAIVVLGPELFRTPDNQRSLHEQLLEELNIGENRNIHRHYEEDDFFLFSRGGGRSFTCEKIYDFYKNQEAGPLLHQLAHIPFHVYLSVSPDKLLLKAFDEHNFNYQFDYYKKFHEPTAIKDPTLEYPLIYNLFGCIDDEESLVLTHNDLYDYFKSIFARRSMPDKLKHALQQREINCFIFLGVPFDKWYMQLLLRELEIHRSSEDFIRYASNQMLDEEVRSFCTEQFTIHFVDQNVVDFVRRLHGECETRGLLRTPQSADRWQRIKDLITRGELGMAIDKFVDLTVDTDMEDDALAISGRYRRYQRKKNQGVLMGEEIMVQANKIQESLIDLVNQAENN